MKGVWALLIGQRDSVMLFSPEKNAIALENIRDKETGRLVQLGLRILIFNIDTKYLPNNKKHQSGAFIIALT
jgi:hypothetical protein